jgi:hypothetical protein
MNIYNNTLRIQCTSIFFYIKRKTYYFQCWSIWIRLFEIYVTKILMLRNDLFLEWNDNNWNHFYKISNALKASIHECQYILIFLSKGWGCGCEGEGEGVGWGVTVWVRVYVGEDVGTRINFIFNSHTHPHDTHTLKLGYLSKYRPTTFNDTFNELPRGWLVEFCH